MLTLEDAKAYLASIGVELPDFFLQLLVDQVNTISDCLEENYDPVTGKLIGLYLLALLGAANADRYISSQSAPSGASQSFKYKSLAERWSATSKMLAQLDTKGCAAALTPPDPTATAHAGIWTAKGGCMCGD